MDYIFVVLSSSFFSFDLSQMYFTSVYLKWEKPTFVWWRSGFLILTINGAPAIPDIRICHWSYFHACNLLYITLSELFTPALADGLSLGLKWQQVTSGLQDSYQYSGRPQQCSSLDGLGSTSDLQLSQSS